ncbi:acyl-CoA N-acyltransferase [Hypoxylon sp. FL0543]|nr:acyl-CoA N-acyltransferase [Hypoxylon sp. FL0543]
MMELHNCPTSATPIVEQATESDIPALVAVWWDAFSSDFIRRIFSQTPDGRRWLERAFVKNFEPTSGSRAPETKCLIVRCSDTGLPAAIAVYRIVPAGCDPAQLSWRARWPPFDDLPDISEDVLAGFFDSMDRTQTYLLGDRAYVYLEALGTMKTHRKRGYATALIEWGTDLADELGVECYLDASPEGRPLYEANGYVEQDVSAVVEKQAGPSMIRHKKGQA